MKTMYTVEVARDRVEFTTVVVRADTVLDAQRAAKREAGLLTDEQWEAGRDVDPPYVTGVEEVPNEREPQHQLP